MRGGAFVVNVAVTLSGGCRQYSRTSNVGLKACASSVTNSKEFETARREARPYRIDVKSLSPVEREELRRRSRAIPLVADKDPLEVVFEDESFLVCNKPGFLKMHPSHR